MMWSLIVSWGEEWESWLIWDHPQPHPIPYRNAFYHRLIFHSVFHFCFSFPMNIFNSDLVHASCHAHFPKSVLLYVEKLEAVALWVTDLLTGSLLTLGFLSVRPFTGSCIFQSTIDSGWNTLSQVSSKFDPLKGSFICDVLTTGPFHH